MHEYQIPYRELHDQMGHYERPNVFRNLVRPWLYQQDSERQWLREFATRPGDPIPSITIEESWRLYALSRTSDLLLLSFAPPGMESEDPWHYPSIEMDEYLEVMTYFGFSRIDRQSYHPFFHEIVVVEQASEPETPVSVREEYWPGFMLGGLLFSRSGCKVRGGTHHIVKQVAENSKLYWAYARNTRLSTDLSYDWGSNSQWRTSFRRDYVVGKMLFYNVDADDQDPYPYNDKGLSAAEQFELLRNRCFVRCDKDSDDRWPYDLRFHEEA